MTDLRRNEFSLNTLRFSSIGVYGREKEISQLNEAFDRICDDSVTTHDDKKKGAKKEDLSNVQTMKKRELVLLSGHSGTGKTSIAQQLEKPTKRIGGFFVSGKFDFQRRSEPYKAFYSAFGQICDEILKLKKSNNAKFKEIKKKIQKAVRCDGGMLAATIIPNIKILLLDSDDDNEVIIDKKEETMHKDQNILQEDEEKERDFKYNDKKNKKTSIKFDLIIGELSSKSTIRNKFTHLVRQFLRAVCDEIPILVLMIDDLQWADNPSIDLIKNIVIDEENSGIMVIGCYRDDEFDCDKECYLLEKLREIERDSSSSEKDDRNTPSISTSSERRTKTSKSTITPINDNDNNADNSIENINLTTNSLRITKIPVGNISVESINYFLEDLFSSNKEETSNLAQIIHHKTQGNIFFVIEFIRSLEDDGMLAFNFGLMKWNWDESLILHNTNVTENVASLISQKMSKVLNDDDKEILSIAACLGATFEFSTLFLVVMKIHESTKSRHVVASDVLNNLRICERENFIVLDEKKVDNKNKRRSSLDNNKSDDGRKTNGVMMSKKDLMMETDDDVMSLLSLPGSYRFVHDQIQEAALSLVEERKQIQLQVRIGEILAESMTGDIFEEKIFIIVDLLNRGINSNKNKNNTNKMDSKTNNKNGTSSNSSAVGDKKRRIYLSRLNLHAGKKAMESSAFITSSMYLRTGIELLGPNCWGTNDDDDICLLSIELFSAAAQTEYCNGNFSDMQMYLDEVLTQTDISFKAKIPAYLTLLESLRAREKHVEAIDTSLSLLSKLGLQFPKRQVKIATLKGLITTKRLMRKYVDKLTELPIMNDKDKKVPLVIMDGLMPSTYLVRSELMPLTVFKMMQYSIKHGMSEYFPVALALYSMILSTMGDFQMAYKIGNLAVTLVDMLGARETRSRVTFLFYSLISYSAAPVATSIKPLLDAYHIGLETGDVENACLSLWGYLCCSLHSGQNLIVLERDMRHYIRKMAYYKQGYVRIACILPWQFVLNLMGESYGDPATLTGEAMNQDEILAHFERLGNVAQSDLVKMTSMSLAFYFGKYELGWKLVESTDNYMKSNPVHPTLWRSLFFQGMTAFALAHKTRRRKWKIQATKIVKLLSKWVSRGNLNCVHVVHLLRAEEAYFRGKTDDASKKYSAAITAAARAGFVQDKALANERAGEFFLAATGDRNQSLYHFDMAYELYIDWGATAKAEDLKKKNI